MTVAELIEILKTMPQDYPVEINDHNRGSISFVDRIDCFGPEDIEPEFVDEDYPCVVIQTETWASE
jgi:hypothetical protein